MADFKFTQTGAQIQAILNNALTNPMQSAGDLIVGGSSGTPTRLPSGSQGQVLIIGSSGPEYQYPRTPIAVSLTYNSNTGFYEGDLSTSARANYTMVAFEYEDDNNEYKFTFGPLPLSHLDTTSSTPNALTSGFYGGATNYYFFFKAYWVNGTRSLYVKPFKQAQGQSPTNSPVALTGYLTVILM